MEDSQNLPYTQKGQIASSSSTHRCIGSCDDFESYLAFESLMSSNTIDSLQMQACSWSCIQPSCPWYCLCLIGLEIFACACYSQGSPCMQARKRPIFDSQPIILARGRLGIYSFMVLAWFCTRLQVLSCLRTPYSPLAHPSPAGPIWPSA